MRIKVAINGFGRVGRSIVRAAKARPDMQGIDFVAVNDLMKPDQLAVSLKYDSVFGPYPGKISAQGNVLIKGGDKIVVLNENDPSKLPWKDLGIEVVVEATRKYLTAGELKKHIDAGAQKVILTEPVKHDLDATIVMGVNDHILSGKEKIVSGTSCTTNCVAPLLKVMNDNFGVNRGFITSVHAYTNDQRLLDYPHKDVRRSRAAALSIIPTSTSATYGVEKAIPELKGKLSFSAYRVPIPDGSIANLYLELASETTVKEINTVMRRISVGSMRGIIEYCNDPVVSVDIVRNTHSCIFDEALTEVINSNFVKISGWYDNEWGFANRILELIQRIY